MRTRAFLEGRRRGQRPGQNSCQTGKIKSLVAINLKKSAFGLLLIFAFLYFLTTPRVAKKSLVGRRLQASGWISGRVRPGGGSTETQLARPQARNRLPRSLDSLDCGGAIFDTPFFFRSFGRAVWPSSGCQWHRLPTLWPFPETRCCSCCSRAVAAVNGLTRDTQDAVELMAQPTFFFLYLVENVVLFPLDFRVSR